MAGDRGPAGVDADGFTVWTPPGDDFNAVLGPIAARVEGPAVARIRMATGAARANALGTLHGGFVLAMVDNALFAAAIALGRIAHGGAVTLTAATQFLDAGRIDRPVDCVVEIARETGRLLFLRGRVEQADTVLVDFQATLRKLGGA